MKKHFFVLMRICIWCIPLLLAVWISIRAIVPSSTISVTFHQTAIGDLFGGFSNMEYFSAPRGSGSAARRDMLGNGSLFFLAPWRSFTGATLSLTFEKPDTRVTLIGVGLPNMEDIRRTLYDPTYASYADWNAIRQGDAVLLQRYEQYSSIAEFLASPPAGDEVMVMNEQIGTPNVEADAAGGEPHRIAAPLLGTHTLYAYVENEPLDVTLTKQDANRKNGPDRLTAFVYTMQGERLFAQTLQDDGDETQSEIRRSGQEMQILLDNLPAGVYRIVLEASTDVMITSLSAHNSQLVLTDTLRAEPSGQPLTVSLYGIGLTVQNTHTDPTSLILNGETVTIPAGTTQSFAFQDIEQHITFSADALVLKSDGEFVFDTFTHFLPRYGFPLLERDVADAHEVNYIYGRYMEPQESAGGLLTTAASFPLADLLKTEAGYRFLIEVDDEQALPLTLGDISATMTKPPLTLKRIVEKATSVFH